MSTSIFFRSKQGCKNICSKTRFTSQKKKNKNMFLAKSFWSQCHILRIIYVLYMYYICIIYVSYMYYMCIICVFAGFIWLFLGFWWPRRFLYVLLLAFAGFSWVFGDR